MSEKECPNDHVFPFSMAVCPVCGLPPRLFDGMSRKEYNWQHDEERDMDQINLIDSDRDE